MTRRSANDVVFDGAPVNPGPWRTDGDIVHDSAVQRCWGAYGDTWYCRVTACDNEVGDAARESLLVKSQPEHGAVVNCFACLAALR